MVQLIHIPLAVDHEHAAGLDIIDHLEALGDIAGVVAGHEVSLVDIIRRTDGLITEAQMADGDAAGLLGIVLEVCLHILVGVVADDLDGVLVGAHGAVTAETPELALDGAGGSGVGAVGILRQGQIGDIVHDADGELALHLGLLQLVIHGEDRGGRRILAAQTVTAADDGHIVHAGIGKSGDNILIQRLAHGAGLLGAVQNGDLLAGGGDGGDELLRSEGTVQAHLHQANLLAVGVEIIDDFLGHIADGAHGHDDTVSVGSAVVVKQLIVGAQLLVDLVHVLLHHGGQSVIVAVAGLAVLEEDVAVFVAAAHFGMLGVQAVAAELGHGVHVAHILQIFVVPDSDLLDLMAGTESVEEVDEGDLAGEGGQMSHGRQVHDLLHIALAQHGKAGLAAGHNVGVVTENVQGVGGHRTGGHMEHAGELLSGDLVHVGNHQQQALRGGICGGQSAGTQRAVYGAGGAGLGLHLHHLDLRAEDVLLTVGGPLVHKVGHGRRRSDGIDGCHFGERIGYMRRGVIAIHGLHFSYHVVCSFHLFIRFFDSCFGIFCIVHSSTNLSNCKRCFCIFRLP